MKALEFIVKEIYEDRLNVHEIQVPPLEIGLEIEETQFVGPVHSHIQLFRYDQDVYVKADFSALIGVECRRCAEPFETDIATEVELQFRHADEPDEEIDLSLIEGGERHYSSDTIDLSEDARQALVLEIPVWPLCSESCKGLCPHCGTNLNIARCNCHENEETSSPFAALADLLNTSDRAVGGRR